MQPCGVAAHQLTNVAIAQRLAGGEKPRKADEMGVADKERSMCGWLIYTIVRCRLRQVKVVKVYINIIL